MTRIDFAALKLHDWLPNLVAGPMTRSLLEQYGTASGDRNPLHLNPAYARQQGLPDVIAHGMLSMAFLARLVTNWVDQSAIRALSVRFIAVTQLGDTVHCRGRVSSTSICNGERRISLELTASGPNGELRLTGVAEIGLPSTTIG